MTARKIVNRESSSCMSKLYQRKICCDFTIISHGKRFEVHKNILALSVPYFEMMFNTNMVESKSNELTLDGSTEALDMVIKWSYCQPITITSDNARKLAEMADYMSIPELISDCLIFLSENTSNAIFSEFSNFINYKGTRKLVERYICINFCDIVSTDEFVTYDFDTINDILSLEDLNIEDELDVFDAIIKWIAADPQHRTDHLGELMKKIYWISVNKTKLVDIASNTYVKSCENARAVMRAAFDLIAFNGSEESKKRKLIHLPRRNPKRFLFRFDRPSIDVLYFESFDQPMASFCLQLDRKLDHYEPKFFDANSADYNLNSCKVIRINWSNRKFQTFGVESELCSCLFGYIFGFATKARGKVRFWKGSRCIKLGQIPDDYPLIMSIAPYKGHFYIVVKEKESEAGWNFRISKFDPIQNIWTKLSLAPEPVPKNTRVLMKINNDKISLFFGLGDAHRFMNDIVSHWIFCISKASWFEHRDFVLKAKLYPRIVVNHTNQIQCFHHQMEIIKSTHYKRK